MGFTAGHRDERIARQVVAVHGRAYRERTGRHLLGRVGQQLVESLHQPPRFGLHQRGGGGAFLDTQELDELGGEAWRHLTGYHHPVGRTFGDRTREQPAGGGNCQQGGNRVGARALAEDRHPVRVAAEGADVVAHPLQREHEVAQEQIAFDRVIRRRQPRQIEATERPEPVVRRHEHAAAAGQRRAVVQRCRRAAQHVSAAVDEKHHRQRLGGWAGRCNDVDGQAVLAHRLVLVDPDQGVAAALRRAEREVVAVANPAPRDRRLRRTVSQPPHRWAGVRDRPPFRHAAAGHTLDSAARGGHADSAIGHSLKVANP